MNLNKLLLKSLTVATVITAAITTGCASKSPSRAEIIMDAKNVGVITSYYVRTKKGYPDRITGTLALGLLGTVTGGLDDGALLAFSNEQNKSRTNPNSRHSAFAYIPKTEAKTPNEFVELIDEQWSDAIERVAVEQGFVLNGKAHRRTNRREDRYDYVSGVKRTWLIDNEEVGCHSDVSPRKRCAVFMNTGDLIRDNFEGHEGELSQFVSGKVVPSIIIRTPHDGPYNQIEFYKSLSAVLGENHYIYLAEDQQVWLGDSQVFNHNVLVNNGEVLNFLRLEQPAK